MTPNYETFSPLPVKISEGNGRHVRLDNQLNKVKMTLKSESSDTKRS